MTNRERALNILSYKPVDRMPAVHFGYWNELVHEWADQGHISRDIADNWGDGNAADLELNKKLGWDFGWQCMAGTNNNLNPWFEYKVLERLPDGVIRYQSHTGIIEKKVEGVVSIPAEDDYLLKDRKAWEELYLPKLQFTKDRINPEWIKGYIDERGDENIRALHMGSVLGSIRDMVSVMGMSYLLCDDYELFGEIIDTYADLQYKCAEEALKLGYKFDVAHFWEDICFKNGPLISPTMFEDLCAKHYKKRTDLCRKYGIEIISLDCDGCIDKLLPIWLENGVNTMFPIEVGTWNACIEPWRKQYGKKLLGVGGMDKTVLRKDKAAVDAELKRIKPLIDLGGYLICPDHRIMPGSKWELVQYYCDTIKTWKPSY